VALLSAVLVEIIYGETYLEAGPVLAVQIWGSIFCVFGYASDQ
jgi:O-antigen/teichoic acid export membrane protein